MKKLITLLSILVGMSFAISAKDFPCISKPTENNECWVKFTDPRDKQEYLAIKHCGVYNTPPSTDTCIVRLVENSRYKSPNAQCDAQEGLYYGCVYPTYNEAMQYACFDLGVERGCSREAGYTPVYEVKNGEYANLRKSAFTGKNDLPQGVVLIKENEISTASPCTLDFWFKFKKEDKNWKIMSSPSVFENIYWRCEYWMSE